MRGWALVIRAGLWGLWYRQWSENALSFLSEVRGTSLTDVLGESLAGRQDSKGKSSQAGPKQSHQSQGQRMRQEVTSQDAGEE